MASILNATTSSGLVTSADNSGSLQLATNNGTTAVTIDTSQNVTFAGNTTISKAQAISFLTNTTGTNSVYSQYTNTGGTAYVGLNNSSGGDFGNAAYALQLFHTGAYPIVFSTTGTERMRITSAGNLGVGTTSPDSKIRADDTANQTIIAGVNSNASFTAAGIFLQMSRNTTNNTFFAIDYYNAGAGAYKFRVADSGNVTNTNNSYGAISDVKLKENIVDATPKLSKLSQVRVVNYNFIGSTEKQLGVVAQELEQIFPLMVEETQDKDAEGNILETTTKAVKYSVFVPMLIKAIQELKAELDATKAEVQALKGTL